MDIGLMMAQQQSESLQDELAEAKAEIKRLGEDTEYCLNAQIANDNDTRIKTLECQRDSSRCAVGLLTGELDALRASTDAFRQRYPIPKSVPITTADDPRIELLRRWVTPNDLGETAANSLVALIEENEGLRGRS